MSKDLSFLLDHRDLFHICLTVDDLEAAMAAYSEQYGVTWSAVEEESYVAIVPGNDHGMPQTSRRCWSMQGPVHIELGELVEGPIRWDGDALDPHHAGYWADDLEATRDALLEQGFTIDFEVIVRNNGRRIPFMRSPRGFGVKLCPREGRDALMASVQRPADAPAPNA
jgi:catechol 2,3-dioxygenase-like lactoylglutathione lyase family enzyme